MGSKPLALTLLTGVLWGSSFVAIEVGLSYFPPILFAGIRYALVGVIVLGYAIVAASRWYPTSIEDVGSILVVGVLMIGAHHAFLYLGMQYVSGAVAAVVVSLSPVLTAVFSSAMLADNDLTLQKITGLVLGLGGVLIISDVGVGAVTNASTVGLSLALLASASFAFGSVATRPLRTDLPVSTLQGHAMVVGAGLLLITGLLGGESIRSIAWTPMGVGSLAFLVIGPGVIAFLVYFYLLDRIGPLESNLIAYLEPIVATILSWVLLGEIIDSSTVLGFLAIVVGFAFVKHRTLGVRLHGLIDRHLNHASTVQTGSEPSSEDSPPRSD